MVSDALSGKIDLIVTKSISRFARNTVDALTTIRQLKESGVEIFFEKENIYTFDSNGEILITIMASLAQEESRSISENLKWAVTKKFEQGKFSLPYKQFLGYDRGPDGMPVINEKEAAVVREIYQRYLAGQSPKAISQELERRKIPAPAGGAKWGIPTVCSILKNEKYCGDAILQKHYTADFLTKKMVQNNGELPKYYVSGSHEGIVSKEVYDLVQSEMASRKGQKPYSANIFSGKVVCGNCGGSFGSKIWHSTDKYRRVVYRCNRKYDGCGSKVHLTEDELKEAVVKALNEYLANKEEVIANLEKICGALYSVADIERELESVNSQIAVSKELYSKALHDKPIFDGSQLNGIQDIYVKWLEKKAKLEAELARRKNARLQMESVIETLRGAEKQVEEFSSYLFTALVDKVVVMGKDEVRVRFRDGSQL